MISFINSFKSEWLKKKGTVAFWLVIIGSFFIPLIMTARGLFYPETFAAEAKSSFFWQAGMNRNWQLMAFFLLPMGVVMATSLITQIEFRNNTWKQLHTSPQSYPVVFLSKLSVIIVMLLQFFLLFNVGIYLSGVIPSLVYTDIDYPQQAFPFKDFLKVTALFFIDCLPIVAFQYLVSLQFKNFLVPLGAGIGLLIASLIAVQWKYGYTIPYTYCPYNFLALRPSNGGAFPAVNIHYMALAYFVGFTIISYLLYITKREKG